MPTISKNSIESLKSQINILDVISPYVRLQKAGNSWKGLSPFSKEKTPSFYVHPDKGFYKCFSSGEGGDCFSFIMKIENLEFPDSAEFLSQKFNISLEYETSSKNSKLDSKRKQLHLIYALVAEWFHDKFLNSKEAKPALDYWLKVRAFDLQIAKENLIGYAPINKTILADFLKKKNFDIEILKESGLFYNNKFENSINLYSRFRGRLIIPIRDINNRIVAFTARKLNQTPSDDPSREAKYINSPETILFHKSKLLFGMHHARKHLKDNNTLLLVEGQLDTIRCWSVGLNTTVAPQGTSITEDQLKIIRRYDPDKIFCLLDGDSAGRKAALRSLNLAFQAGLEFEYIKLPENKDPDDMIKDFGLKGFENLKLKSLKPMQLLIEEIMPNGASTSTREKTKACKIIFEHIASVKSVIAQEDHLKVVSKTTKLNYESLLKDFNAFKSKEKYSTIKQSNQNPVSKDNFLKQANWELLYLIVKYPKYGKKIAHSIDLDYINKDSIINKFLSKLLAEYFENQKDYLIDFEKIIENNEERQLLADISIKELDIDDPLIVINECIKTIKKNVLKREKIKIKNFIIKSDLDDSEMILLMKKIQKINKEILQAEQININ